MRAIILAAVATHNAAALAQQIKVGRDLGLLTLDLLPPAKRAFARRAMGRAGRVPRLARGLPL